MKRVLRDNGLGIAFGLLFVGALVGQALTGHADYNNQQIADGSATVTLLQYVTSSDFGVDVAENWQSEYLQFFLYIFARAAGARPCSRTRSASSWACCSCCRG